MRARAYYPITEYTSMSEKKTIIQSEQSADWIQPQSFDLTTLLLKVLAIHTFSLNGISPLVKFDRTMTAYMYQDILSRKMLPYTLQNIP